MVVVNSHIIIGSPCEQTDKLKSPSKTTAATCWYSVELNKSVVSLMMYKEYYSVQLKVQLYMDSICAASLNGFLVQ